MVVISVSDADYSMTLAPPAERSQDRLLKKGADRMVSGGYISLQSESHPVEFRKVELKRLDAPPAK